MPTLLAKNASVLVTMDDGNTYHRDAHNRFAQQFAGHS